MFTPQELEAATALVHRHMEPTPLYRWPLLETRLSGVAAHAAGGVMDKRAPVDPARNAASGTELWVKHENHGPTGAFKVRGGITFIYWLRQTHPECPGVVTATRGNHGQSQARAAVAAGLRAVVYVPRGNSVEKNAAMRAFGAELREFGADFDAAREEAMRAGTTEGLYPVPPFHPELVRGVASYGYEMFTAKPDLDTVYVPIGCGSGICGVIAARDALGLECDVVGVVSDGAQTAKLSVEAGRLVETPTARTFADGMAVRVPVQAAFDIYSRGAARIVSVSDAQIADAIRAYFTDTHNLAEGAGAAPLAAALAERDRLAGRRVAVILCGGNIDTDWFVQVMQGAIPVV